MTWATGNRTRAHANVVGERGTCHHASAYAARGLLHIDDPGVAAEQLTWLVLAAPLNRLTLEAGAHPYSDNELEAVAAQGVATFMSRYGPEDKEPR